MKDIEKIAAEIISTEQIKEKKEVRENLAELCHSQWSGWMKYLFSKGTFNVDGTWTMPKWAVKRWTKQMNTKYNELSDSEMDSDRTEADKFIALILEKNE